QADDGIRARTVTGVQTCALPISGLLQMPNYQLQLPMRRRKSKSESPSCNSLVIQAVVPLRVRFGAAAETGTRGACAPQSVKSARSEERRVGKEGRRGWAAGQQKH